MRFPLPSRMHPFDRLPFREQLARIEAAAAADDTAVLTLMKVTGAMADAEPFSRLTMVLAEAGRLHGDALEELKTQSATLADPALQYLLSYAERGERTSEALRALVLHALSHWPIARISAIALLSRWLRRRFPDDAQAFRETAHARLHDGSRDPRWLLFASGATLGELSHDPAWSPLVEDAVSEALAALANAPKSISQANAESLLARRVYADPGHFFFELLQNADDANAATWRASISERGVQVEHDGRPFSFRDVVGLLSIGQTTKRKDQIGFFGVGFKSIYEICERPRVRSGIFHFEIAHVSIPRSLSSGVGASVGAKSDDLTIVDLPYASGVDAQMLFRKALAIPPETLLTLPNVRALAISRDISGEVDDSWAWAEEWDGDVATLRRARDAESRSYLCARREFTHPGAREAGRAHTSPILVAIAMNEDEQPRPMRGPTLYAFLPTAEHTGLRCMIHARFDVTLDRERLEHDSAWNRALLRAAGETFADLAKKLADRGRSVLPILSAPSERAPVATPFSEALCEALHDFPCLPGADGTFIPPRSARIVGPELCAPLAGLDLGDGQRALAPLAPREQEVAVSLGASAFTHVDLVHFAADALVAGESPPTWYGDAVLGSIGDADVDDSALEAIALLIDGGGCLQSPRDATQAAPVWSTLYASIRPLVNRRFLDALPASLRERLRVPDFDATTLAADLAHPELRPALIEREDALLGAISTLSASQRGSLAERPILRATDGRRCALTDGLHRLDPALAMLRDEVAKRVPLVAEDLSARFASLLSDWVPPFGLTELAALLPRAPSPNREPSDWSETSLDSVVSILRGSADSLPRDLAKEFASCSIFRDQHGARRPLIGTGRALIPADGIDAVFPTWPWIADPGGAFVASIPTHTLTVPDVAALLAVGGDLERPIADGDWVPALTWLSERADRLASRDVRRLLAARLWLDVDLQPRPVAALRRPGGSPEADAFFRSTNTRFVAHPVSIALADALCAAGEISPSDAGTAIRDLLVHGPAPSTPTTMLAALLNEATNTLEAGALKQARELPIFRDAHGALRPLAAWSSPNADAVHRPGSHRAFLSAGALPLLHEEDETRFAKFLYAAGPAPATAADLVTCLQNDHALLGEPAQVRRVLSAHASELDADARDALNALPIFESQDGVAKPACALFSHAALSTFLIASDLEALGLDARLITPAQEPLTSELGLSLRPVQDMLTEMLSALTEDAPLEAQPAPWNTRAALTRLLRLARHHGLDERAWPLAIDRSRVVTRAPLATASDATRALAAALSIQARFADEAWRELLSDEERAEMLDAVPLRRVTGALQSTCPDELPIEAHPVLSDAALVFRWLAENRHALAEDDAALASLSSAAVIPSQKNTFRCPRDLILDPSIPELGLRWGVSRDVPEGLARWLADTFELDRRQRRNVIDHVLTGLDAAAEADDAPRAKELLAFLASALGASELSADKLAERASHTKVRARLRVPLHRGGWDKPRRARLARADGELVDAFCIDPPDRVALGALEPSSRALLSACGATEGLSEKHVRACLSGEGLKPGPAARRALAHYVALRVVAEPRLRVAFGLDALKWIPTRSGQLAKASDLLWPDALGQALLGDSSERFPAPEVVLGLPANAAATIGFRRSADLSMSEVAAFVGTTSGEGAASSDVLDWLESGLQTKRFSPNAVRAAFASTLRLRDDSGEPRLAAELALDGARVLFGPWRGDFSERQRFPCLGSALSIPDRPNVAMILSFLEEISAHEAPENEATLDEVLPRCFERLSELGRGVRRSVRLPAACLIAGRRDGARVLSRLNDPRVRVFRPAGLARALPEPVRAEFIELLPATRDDDPLAEVLLRSGARDLWSDFEVRRVLSGPVQRQTARAEHLWTDLQRVLGERVGRGVRVVDPLSVEGALALPIRERGTGSYRGVGDIAALSDAVTTEVDAVVHDDILWLTPAAVDAPERLAPALERDPVRRAAMATWLEKREWASLPKRLRRKKSKASPSPASMFDRIRGFFRGDDAPERVPKRPARPKVTRAIKAKNDERFFRPNAQIHAQLGSSDGWLDRRRMEPDFGFAFTPERLASPWLYAPKTIATHFHRRRQSWDTAALTPPPESPERGMVVFRGKLPRGAVVLPVPMFGTVRQLAVDDATVSPERGAFGQHLLRLDREATVVLHVALGQVPDLNLAAPAMETNALTSSVPDDELPEEVHDFLRELDPSEPVFDRALRIREFIRDRYRYDPSYLEDPGLGRWLARITRGRANAHIAALHAGGDGQHLGAGVCYELNALACELLRRAEIPAAIATGWVLDGGALSDPDHLWCVALLQDARGAPLWVPIDAASTRSGRPLRVARRPAGRFRAPKDRRAKAPKPSRWELGTSATRGSSTASTVRKRKQPQKKQKRPKKRARAPRAELLRVIRHLENLTGRALTEEDKRRVANTLDDPKAAARLLTLLGSDAS